MFFFNGVSFLVQIRISKKNKIKGLIPLPIRTDGLFNRQLATRLRIVITVHEAGFTLAPARVLNVQIAL